MLAQCGEAPRKVKMLPFGAAEMSKGPAPARKNRQVLAV
jgi:hypothetical protein